MRRILWVGIAALVSVAALLAAGTMGWYAHLFFGNEAVTSATVKSSEEARILGVLKQMKETGKIEFGVPEIDGRRMRMLAEAIGARNIVEVGTSTGYSGLWLCLGALPADGHITTFELDPRRAAMARQHFREAGVDGRIEVVLGDAHAAMGAVKAPIDLVFLDADKEGYLDYVNKLLPLVRPGGLILAHNVTRTPDYMLRVTTDPALDTVALTQGSGLSVTLKKR